jgi:hypothetical protein
MQLVKLAKAKDACNTCPWGVFTGLSVYDPCDLCSRDPARIRAALTTLFQNPQNNLRICVDGEHIFGWDKPHTTEYDAVLSSSLLGGESPINALVDLFVEEPILEDLEAMQALDTFFDIEGCAAILKRLANFFETSADSTKEMRDFISYISPMEINGELKAVYEWARSLRGGDTTILSTLNCDSNILLSKLLDLAKISSVESVSSEETENWLQSLDVEYCRVMLQLWLLALGAKDASVIVTLRRSDTSPSGWNSKLSLIDYGPKALSKIWKKISEEEEICRIANLFSCPVSCNL